VVETTPIDPILLQNEWQQMEIEMKRLVQQAEGFPPNVRNIELKYSLADWELARTKTVMTRPHTAACPWIHPVKTQFFHRSL
jgi:hypothetical protein